MSDIVTVVGLRFETNKKLKDRFKVLLNQKGGPMTKELLINFVDNNILVPIISSPGIIKKFIMAIRGEKPQSPFYGVTISREERAYVVFDPVFKEKDIVDTALHEVVHVSYIKYTKEFTRINNALYMQFYSYYFKEYFEASSYNKTDLEAFLNDLNSLKWNWRTYDRYLYNAFHSYSELPEEQFDSRLALLKSIVYTYLYRTSRFPHYNIALALIRKTYRHLFKNMDYTAGVGQELFAPNEIVAILSTISSSHQNVIKSLKLLQKK
jgi:hypothetical protein